MSVSTRSLPQTPYATPAARPTSLPQRISSLLLAADGHRLALADATETVNYDALRERVRRRSRELGLGDRSLVILAGGNSLEWVVSYLALLETGHVPLLVPDREDHLQRLAGDWSPVAIVRVDGPDVDVQHTTRAAAEPTELHPDLALLLSTSGSTGSPKLVRLSHRNLISNAEAIAEYLRIGEHDRGITSLPTHYCYGLSVIHSHLVRGASVAVTDRSVVDPCFRDLLVGRDVTNVAGVPHTFEMLDRVGADQIRTPSLRFVTQAGGRLAPDAVARWVDRTQRWGAEFFVMYGQTEATARMAYLPPHLAARRPGAIGVPIPGGSFELRPVDDVPAGDPAVAPATGDEGAVEVATDAVDGIGELVYRGSNVMMGHAVEQSDLALGHTLDELRTGDLARYDASSGVYEVVGRAARFVKPFGLRIDLDRVEFEVRERTGVSAVAVAGDDSRLVAVVAAPVDAPVDQDPTPEARAVAEAVAEITGLPLARITVRGVDSLPRTASDKVDYAAVLGAGTPSGAADTDLPDSQPDTAADVIGQVLGRTPVGPDDTFVSLGGDSLSYVECSIRLERLLGALPPDWHLRPVSALTAADSGTRSRWLGRVDTTVLLRAAGICLVVATHMRLWHVPGGAHTLLVVVGYNLARFLMPIESTAGRVRAGLRTVAKAAVPVVAWTAVGLVLGASYGIGTLLLVNNYVGPASHQGDHWHFWFIEVFVHLVLLTTLLFAVPQFRRADRRFPYAVPVAVLLGTLLLRMEWAQAGDWYNLRYRTHGIAWFLVLGWVIHRSQAWWQRAATTVLCLAMVPGFFRIERRDWMIALALVALVWLREVPFPRRAIEPVGLLAAASLWIYISHFTIWPPLDSVLVREVAYVTTIAAGVAVWLVVDRSPDIVAAVRRRRSSPDPTGSITSIRSERAVAPEARPLRT